jgi:hypothetical protein
MNERLIWRPNALTPDEWDNLTREQQIKWWKDQENREPKIPSPNPLWAAQLYRQGKITKADVSTIVFENLTEKNLWKFLDGCPADVLQELREVADQYPADDNIQAWEKLVSIAIACYAPWVSVEEIRQGQQERRLRFRQGIRLFRTHA